MLLLFSKTFRRLVGLVLLAAVVLVGGTAARVWWVARQDARPVSDAIVVLGASQADGRPGPVFQARLDHAAALFAAGVAPRVVTVGGGQPGDRFTEADSGARYLQDKDVAVVAVPRGDDTLSSLRAAEVLLDDKGWRSVVVVTDPWHALRARRMADDLGLDAVSSPTRMGPSVEDTSRELRYVARETAAYLYYRAFGRSTDSGPDAL